MVTLTINGQSVSVSRKSTIIEAAAKLGIEIPALCYDENLEPVGACRLCVVDVQGARGLLTACSTPVAEGMVVETETERVIDARRGVLRLLLDNHPNDCLTCEKAGSCLLQKYSYKYDVKFDASAKGARRAGLLDDSNPYIMRDDSKCILCGKCVRICGQVSERSVLAFSGRGFDTKVVFDGDASIAESKCVSCLRCVSVCPTGALIDARATGSYRPWEVQTVAVKCKQCDSGCDFDLLKRNGETVAIKPQPPTSGRPLCLKGRLATELEYISSDKLKSPQIKENGSFKICRWSEALGLDNTLSKIIDFENKAGESGK
ncbi:formate dehydrogenase subunit beta [Peptoclostridium acidaminophilum DSM 3953]|uniref:Ferredoxin n=2 Tax=Peptoclostridium acidaminophilum TaxID=1731 RepID=W8TM94_PEPAC|nr:2Fe-2S iron-sulfur cluster-binding protein [Peptoclostridium acidaminophilum]AHM57327.1 formate dehydrogenase subunit beta [Peptoclostridium acidaminophilum DSM 3953]CAC39238.1 FdhB-II protein [Peptoclostridium acidaminophilum DSM 3953]